MGFLDKLLGRKKADPQPESTVVNHEEQAAPGAPGVIDHEGQVKPAAADAADADRI